MVVVAIAMVVYCVKLLSLNQGWYTPLESSVGSGGGENKTKLWLSFQPHRHISDWGYYKSHICKLAITF